jgi:predicted nucleic acid-binding protein
MIVVDASVLANAIGDDEIDGRVAREVLRAAKDLAAPDLVDVETVSALRKRWLAGTLTEERFDAAVGDLEDLDLDRYPGLPLLRRVFELRANLTAYDAAYVALAEALGCELITADGRLAGAPGLGCPIKVLS